MGDYHTTMQGLLRWGMQVLHGRLLLVTQCIIAMAGFTWEIIAFVTLPC